MGRPHHGLQGPSDADELAKPRISCYSSAHRPACQSSTSRSGSYLSPTPTNPHTSRAGRIGPPPVCDDIEVRAMGPRLRGAASTCLPWQPREDGTKQRAQLASISQAPATTAPASRSSLHRSSLEVPLAVSPAKSHMLPLMTTVEWPTLHRATGCSAKRLRTRRRLADGQHSPGGTSVQSTSLRRTLSECPAQHARWRHGP